jgi:hypothetical protein
MLNEQFLYIECGCGSLEHNLQFRAFNDDREIYCHTFLSHRKFRDRIIPALKYIFGYKCKYGHFEEIILDVNSQMQIMTFIRSHLTEMDKRTPVKTSNQVDYLT